LLIAVPAFLTEAYSLSTLLESSRLFNPRAGGFFNRRYGDFAPALTRIPMNEG
jgi:hypothetical protein